MATVYIDPAGSDSRTYSEAQNISTPWQTPGKVYSSATTGDTCICLNGTYTITASITVSKSITWQAQTNGSVIWDDNNGQHQITFNTSGLTTSFTGIKFYRWKFNTSVGVIFNITAGASSTATISFTNCTFDTFALKDHLGLAIGGLIGCSSNNSSQTVTLTMTNCIISNVTYDTSSTGTCLITSRATSSTFTCTLNNCTVYLPSTSAAILRIVNDTNATTKITLAGKNNIVYCGTSITWGATSSTMTYSDGYQVTSFPGNTGNITSDPLFVDAANANYNLRPTSPCLNTGTLV